MNFKDRSESIVHFLASLKLAVFVILLLAALTAAGTIVESKYNDAIAASKLVYHTPWMIGTLGLLAVNLTAVMVDRWPWRRRHLSFILAHIGILILLFGSLLTMKMGLDGSMPIRIGQSSRYVQGSTTELSVWASYDGDKYAKLSSNEVDFFTAHPEKNPVVFHTDSGDLKVIDFKPYMLASRRVKSSPDQKAGAAVQFQLQNSRVNVTEWLVQDKPGKATNYDLGPARVFLGPDPHVQSGRNEIYVEPAQGKFRYTVYKADGQMTKSGLITEGEKLDTGWMGLQFKVLQFIPKAEYTWDYREAQRASDLTTSAIKLQFQGEEHWLQIGDVLKLFTEKAVYIVSYGHHQIDIGFDVALDKFEVGHDPGTQKAASYQSQVRVTDLGERVISMNEPLTYKGLTLYQASFNNGPDGQPETSVFSVNYDPGRVFKHLGCLIIVSGVILMFYDRRKSVRAQLAPKVWEES